MKKIMSLMLGLSLLSGMVVFAGAPDETKTSKSKKTGTSAPKGKKKKATTTATK